MRSALASTTLASTLALSLLQLPLGVTAGVTSSAWEDAPRLTPESEPIDDWARTLLSIWKAPRLQHATSFVPKPRQPSTRHARGASTR